LNEDFSSRSTSLYPEASQTHPEAFGPFRVLHQIGAGALGPVFRAYNPDQDRLVAIKLFRLDLPPERVHRLVAQLQTLIDADLTHAAIAAPVATGIVDVSAYLALDFVAAESADVVAREHGPAPPIEGLRVATQLAGALEFAVDASVAHGALHPRDVLVSADDTKLTGLGIAQVLERIGVAAPIRRPYAAPERVAGAAWDRRADIFSLAALVHELIWGRRITGIGEQAAAALTPVDGADIERLRRLFAKALAEDPARRFDSPVEFADALRSALSAGSRTAIANPVPAPAPVAQPIESEPAPLRILGALPHEVEMRLPLDDETARIAEITLNASVAHAEPAMALATESVPDAPDDIDDIDQFDSDATIRTIDSDATIRTADSDATIRTADSDATIKTFDRPLDEPQVGPESSLKSQPMFAAAPPQLDRARSAVWPLTLALAIGLSVGFAIGYGVAARVSPQSPVDQAVLATAGAPARGVAETEVSLKPEAAGGTGAPASLSNEVRPTQPAAALPSDPAAGADRAPATPQASGAASPRSAPPEVARERPAAAGTGRLLIRSTPPATAFLDGREAGQTPLTISAVQPGVHRVRVAREGFVAEEQSVTITSGRPSQSVTFQLSPLRRAAAAAAKPAATPGPSSTARAGGALTVESRPSGANVLLDGRAIGKTPLTLGDVTAGPHQITIELSGFRSWTSAVRVLPGERNRVAASLER
jgi:serine/threonine-protein kinase